MPIRAVPPCRARETTNKDPGGDAVFVDQALFVVENVAWRAQVARARVQPGLDVLGLSLPDSPPTRTQGGPMIALSFPTHHHHGACNGQSHRNIQLWKMRR